MLNAEAAFRGQKEKTFLAGRHVFLSPEGKPLDLTHLRNRVWIPALKRLGLRHRPLYTCRHTFISLALEAGESVQWVALQVGHTSSQVLYEHYARHIPSPTRRDGSAISSLWKDSPKWSPGGP